MSHSRQHQCLDAVPPALSAAPLPLLDECQLPLPANKIPQHVTTLMECAANEIQVLSQQSSWTTLEEDALDDGFFLCDLKTVHAKLDIWRRMFPTVKPFFAVKCHPDPMITAVLGQHKAAGFDCASLSEIQLALASNNHDTRQIIYANPQRAEDALEQALKLGVRVLTFDGQEELHKIHRIYHERVLVSSSSSEKGQPEISDESSCMVPPQMVLRILVPDDHSTVPLGEKFGATPDQWSDLVQLAMELSLPVIGVSFHCGSGNHDPASYVQAIHLAKEAFETITKLQPNIKPWLVDIGGGYPGLDGCGGDKHRFTQRQTVAMGPTDNLGTAENDTDHETTCQIAQAVTPLLKELFDNDKHPVYFVAEPGRYFVEAAFALCSRIYKVQIMENNSDASDDGGDSNVHYHYYIAQGVQGVFKDTLLCGETFTPQPLRVASVDVDAEELFLSTVHGPSGEGYDLVCPAVNLPRLQTGDWLIFDRMGAYTLSIASRSGQPPVRYVW